MLKAVHLASLGVAPEEMQSERSAEIEVERPKDVQLHSSQFRGRVGVVGDVNEVVHFRGKYFFILWETYDRC